MQINQVTEEILQKLDLLSLFSEYLNLKKAGKSFKANCPFHQEKTPSFIINPQTGLWYCFGCGEGGNAFQFIMKMEKLEFPQALEMLAKRAGVNLPRSAQEKKVMGEKERLLSLLESATVFYRKTLLGDHLALEYLKKREITPQTTEKFRLGVTASGRDSLYKYLLSQEFTKEEIIKSSLVLVLSNGEIVDYLKNRLIFPISDYRGNVVGFGGRLTGEGEPKYLNTQENYFFKKGNLLYGMSLARNPIAKQDWALVVEGYMDVLALSQAGFDNVVASMGTSLTLAQATLLRRFCSKCLLAFDADKAGQAATLRGIDIFEAADLRAKVFPLPEGEDPDSLVRKFGLTEVQKLLKQSKEVIDYQIEEYSRKFDLEIPEDKGKFVQAVIPIFLKIKDPIKLDGYLEKFCDRYKIREDSIRKLLGHRSPTPQAKTYSEKFQTPRPAQPALKFQLASLTPEERLLVALLHKPELIIPIKKMITPQELPEEWAGQLFQQLSDSFDQGNLPAVIHLQRMIDKKAAEKLTRLLMQEELSPLFETDLRTLIMHIKKKSLEKQLEDLKKRVIFKTRAGKILPDDEDNKKLQEIRKQIQELIKGEKDGK